MTPRTYRTYQALILGAAGIFLLFGVMDGRFIEYIHQRSVMLVVLAAAGMLILAQLVLRERPAPEESSEQAESRPHGPAGGNRQGWMLWLMALPLLIGVLTPERHPGETQSPLPVPEQGDHPVEVLYLSPTSAPELWRVSLDGKSAVQLTFTGGKVFDYAVSPDGERIIYAAQNDQLGFDLWEISRQGGEPELLLPCEADWCINPAYAPDGSRIAYSRRSVDLTGGEPGVPRLWLLDLPEKSTEPVYTDVAIGGFEPVWSPTGQHLAFVDGLANGTRIYDFETQTDFFLPSQTGITGAWLPDGSRFLFTIFESTESPPYTAVYEVDLRSQEVRRMLPSGLLNADTVGAADENNIDFSLPQVAADGEWAVVALRLVYGSPSKQLWLIRLDGSDYQLITDEPQFTHSSYRWDSAGEKLVFQRLKLGSSSSLPQILLWDQAQEDTVLLAEDAFLPHWAP